MKQAQHDIKHGHYTCQPRLKVSAQAMVEALEITDDSDHQQGSFHSHALVPDAFLAQFEVWRDAVLAAKAEVAQHNNHAIVALNAWVKLLIMRIDRKQNELHLPQPLDINVKISLKKSGT